MGPVNHPRIKISEAPSSLPCLAHIQHKSWLPPPTYQLPCWGLFKDTLNPCQSLTIALSLFFPRTPRGIWWTPPIPGGRQWRNGGWFALLSLDGKCLRPPWYELLVSLRQCLLSLMESHQIHHHPPVAVAFKSTGSLPPVDWSGQPGDKMV